MAFPPYKKGEFEDFEKATDILESDLAEPSALDIDRGEDVFVFVGALVVGGRDLLAGFLRIRSAVEAVQVIDKEFVEEFFSRRRKRGDVLQIQKDTAR